LQQQKDFLATATLLSISLATQQYAHVLFRILQSFVDEVMMVGSWNVVMFVAVVAVLDSVRRPSSVPVTAVEWAAEMKVRLDTGHSARPQLVDGVAMKVTVLHWKLLQLSADSSATDFVAVVCVAAAFVSADVVALVAKTTLVPLIDQKAEVVVVEEQCQ
jgi:hypothetical protein